MDSQTRRYETTVMLLWIKHHYPKAVEFYCGGKVIRSIEFYLAVNKASSYETMTLVYGEDFTEAVIKYFISVENYEKCQQLHFGLVQSRQIRTLCP